jgi:hypothetical protein
MWAALLLAAAIIFCNKEPEKSQAPERSGDVFKADIAGKEWQADSLSIQYPKENALALTGILRKSLYEIETFSLVFSEITAPGEYAMVAQEKSESGKAGAVFLRTMPIEEAGIYKSVSGTMRVEHISASGIGGTFTAQMQGGGAGRTLAIDNGRFDIDFEAMIQEQTRLLTGMWKGIDYSRSWIASQEGVRGAVYHSKKKRWLINKSVLEFAADGAYQALHEKQQHRWRVERPGVLSMDGIMYSFIVMPEYLQITQPASGEMKGYIRIHELPGLE